MRMRWQQIPWLWQLRWAKMEQQLLVAAATEMMKDGAAVTGEEQVIKATVMAGMVHFDRHPPEEQYVPPC